MDLTTPIGTLVEEMLCGLRMRIDILERNRIDKKNCTPENDRLLVKLLNMSIQLNAKKSLLLQKKWIIHRTEKTTILRNYNILVSNFDKAFQIGSTPQ